MGKAQQEPRLPRAPIKAKSGYREAPGTRIMTVRHLHRLLAAALAVSLMAGGTAAARAETLTANKGTIESATFSATPPTPASPKGVSPEVYFDEATRTYYLLTTSMPPVQYTSADGANWTATSVALPNRGLDWSIVKEGPAAYRLYFAEFAQSAPGSTPARPCTPGSKVLRYATSTDLLSWSVQPGNLLDDVGCGVPHVMKTRAGSYFLYMNKQDPVHGVYRATSNDGLSWTQLPGIIADNSQLVDPAPLELPDGTFVMVGSSMGAQTGGKQELQLLSSPDAITWTQRKTPLYSANGASALDPSIELVDGKLKVWFGYAPGYNHSASQIASGTLTLGSSATPSTSSVKPGAKCKKKGAKSGQYVCALKRGTLIWVRR